MAGEAQFNVMERRFGAAGNGNRDDTAAFQRALNAAERSGAVVFAPPGTYRIEGHLEIPPYVTLEGVFRAPPMHRPDRIPGRGTTLLALAGRNDPDGRPFISLEGPSSTVKGIAVFYPQQSPDNVVPYPWTIQDRPRGSNNAVIDVLLVNSYQGVDFSNGARRHLIRQLYGEPLSIGIRVDQCTDLGRIEDVHFWPFWVPWTENENLRRHLAENATALVLRRSDWQIVHNFFCFGYRTGILFEASPVDQPGTQRAANGQITNLNLDSVGVGLDVRALKHHGMQVSNANFAMGEFAPLYPERRAVWGRPELDGALAIRGATIWGQYDEVVLWDAPQGSLVLSTSIFDSWRPGMGAVRIERGRAILQGNSFTRRIGDSFDVKSTADEVTLVNNQLFGNPIRNQGTKTIDRDNQA